MGINDLIPKIEGFQPIPNAVMIPFMEAQSAALAFGFGLNYEYGKRKVRSMSNEEFNSLTSEQIANMSNEHTHIILSQFQAQIPKVMPMQIAIFEQYVEIEKDKVLKNVELFKWVAANAPQILVEGQASDTASGIRTDSSNQKSIGTETPQGVIVGYINGVPQYKAIPAKTPSRRTPTNNTNADEKASANQIIQQYNNVLQKTAELASIDKIHNQMIRRLKQSEDDKDHPTIQGKFRTASNKMSAHRGQVNQLLKVYSQIYNTSQQKHKSKYGRLVTVT